jgi:hypothetical protein
MFACRDATSLMTEESEGALSGWARVKYRLHVFICPGCRAYHRQLGETIAVVKEIPREGEPVASDVEERLVAAFRARKGGGE